MLGRRASWAVGLGLVAVLLGGCVDDGDVAVLALESGGTGTVAFDLDGSPVGCTGPAGAGHEISAAITVIGAQGSPGSQYPSIGIVFPGGTAGTFTEADGVVVTYAESAASAFIAMTISPGTSCTVTITEYGPVGGLVVGTFSAVVSDGSNTLTISNGTFCVVRGPDA